MCCPPTTAEITYIFRDFLELNSLLIYADQISLSSSVAEPFDFGVAPAPGAACENNGSSSTLKSRKTQHIFLPSLLTFQGFKSNFFL